MKTQIQIILTLLLFSGAYTGISQCDTEEISATPYFKIISEDNDAIETLPLKSSHTEVNIAGIVADVVVTQEYTNTGSLPIEATYIFPASTRAAVYHMEMKIGDRIIKAKIKEKKEAQKIYHVAKKEGKRASLLSQSRPNLFTMNIANILPGDTIAVTLRYTETVNSDKGVYSFIYPTTVGPRYEGEVKNADQKIPAIQYSPESDKDNHQFSLDMKLSTGLPIQDISSKTHEIDVNYNGLDNAQITIKGSKHTDRDFELTYNLMQEKVASGLLLFEGEKENHFLMTIQPPKVVTDQDIPNREYIFVVDVSGSMNGFPLSVTKNLMRNLLGNLRSGDKFNVLLFASTANMLSTESVYATPTDINSAINFLSQRQGSGGTRLMNALQKVMALPKCDDQLSRSVVIVTDGYISVEKNVFDLIRQNNGEFNFYSFGIGGSINRYLIEGIAHVSNTQPLFIKSHQEAKEKADRFQQRISTPVMTNIDIQWGDLDVYDVEPGQINDVLAERPIQIMGKYKGKVSGDIVLSGTVGSVSLKSIYNAAYAKPSTQNKAIQYIWAREKIKILDDYIRLGQTEAQIQEVTQLGIDYNLLTQYTSFVAVDETPTYATNSKGVKHPLSYPKGVSKLAGGGVQLAQSNGIGADLTISNELISNSNSFKFEYSKHSTSSLIIKMITAELENKLRHLKGSLSSKYPYDINLKLTLLTDGTIQNQSITITSKGPISAALQKEIKDVISTWKLLSRPTTSIEITLSNLAINKSI